MIAVIRIVGKIGVNFKLDEALNRLYLRRKYTLTLIKQTEENYKLLKKLRNLVAYGEINSAMLVKLIEERAKLLDSTKKIDPKKILTNLETKSLKEVGLKPFFRLHPPRGGIDSKKHAGVNKGVLGNNKEKINELIRRML